MHGDQCKENKMYVYIYVHNLIPILLYNMYVHVRMCLCTCDRDMHTSTWVEIFGTDLVTVNGS